MSLDSIRGGRSEDDRARDRRRRALGRYGEGLALGHLRARGFTLLARNYRTHHGEIDLIVFDGCTLVFVEVKTRLRTSGTRMSLSPLEWLSASQLARLRQIARAWLADPRHTCPTAQTMRFDAIGVLVDARGLLVDIEHVEGGE
jgi:putative endonuclease